MAVFNDFELTNSGINLLAEVSTGKSLIFTKIQLGKGNFTGNVKYLTSLFDEFKEVNVDDVVIHEDKSVDIKSVFDNVGFTEAVEWKEIGIFAKAGETGTEVLYSYSYSTSTVETIPARADMIYRKDLSFRNYISDTTDVTYVVNIVKDRYDFDSVSLMQNATYLTDGDRVNVWGTKFSEKYRIGTTDEDGTAILLNNGLYANSISKTEFYTNVASFDTDFELLPNKYYEVVDAEGNRYSVRVADDLYIADGEVIVNYLGYIRLQGVKLPAQLAIRDYPVINNNTNQVVLLEVESDFENAGNPTAIKSLVTDVGLFEYGSDEISKLDRGNYQGTAEDLANTKAPLASPNLTGTPTAPTPATGDNSTKIATTAFVKSGLTIKLDTVSGEFPPNQNWIDKNEYAFNLNNSDILGLNNLFFNDVSGGKEGLQFIKTDSVNNSNNLNDYTVLRVDGAGTGYIGGEEIVTLTSSNFSSNGFRKTSDGFIQQWGIATSSGSTTFPITFPTKCLQVVACDDDPTPNPVGVESFTTSKVTMSTNGDTSRCRYIAIGY